MSEWTYQNKKFTADDVDSYVGFVYVITNLSNNKKYIGKKLFWKTKKLPPLKGRKNKRIKKVQSDWESYFGSNIQLQGLVEQEGIDNFKREILRLCKNKAECSYYELKEQVDREVLFKPDEYYNAFVGTKIHRNHLVTKTP